MTDTLRSKALIVAWLVAMAVLPCSTPAHGGEATDPDQPVIKAAALYMVELKSGRVLLEKHSSRRLPPASLTKVMTALVALEAASPEQVVQVDARALTHRSSLRFRAGEQFLLRDLLTAMLVTSANDACETIAWHVGGEPKQFVAMMNARAGTSNRTKARPNGAGRAPAAAAASSA